ncbi:hypothetical protein TNCV_984901 [Trichonephila clavipes]|nr:hypothetical protein TNCV_984901 [Trichonephila clavipes]
MAGIVSGRYRRWNIIGRLFGRGQDGVEKLAYQLNEEAERTERPIRRLNKVMYGSTCADMQQLKSHGCCLSEKWRIINLLDDIWMLYQVDSLGSWRKASVRQVWLQEYPGNCSQHRFTTLETISNYRNSYPGFSSGRPRGTTPADDRHIVLQPEETGGRQRDKSLDTRHRRLDDRYRVLPWPEDCMVVVCLHDALYGVYL